MDPFVKIVNGSKPLTIFAKAPSQIFDRALNTNLGWICSKLAKVDVLNVNENIPEQRQWDWY